MKPFAKQLERIPCTRCDSAKRTIMIKGSVGANGKIRKAIKEIGQCPVCYLGPDVIALTPEQIAKVESQFTKSMIAKEMYEVKGSRVVDGVKWNHVKWTGSWDDETIRELTRAIGDACYVETEVDGEIVKEPGLHIFRGEKTKVLIRDECMPALEETLESPIFQDGFSPFARLSEERIAALEKAFEE